MEARRHCRGVVANPAKATSLGRGPRLTTKANPSPSSVPGLLCCGPVRALSTSSVSRTPGAAVLGVGQAKRSESGLNARIFNGDNEEFWDSDFVRCDER